MTTSNGKTINGCNNWFRDATNLFLNIKNTEARYTVLTDISTAAFHILITTATKSFISRTCNNHHINCSFFPANTHGITHFPRSSGCKSITITFPVNCYAGYTIVKIKKNIFIFLDCLPFSFC